MDNEVTLKGRFINDATSAQLIIGFADNVGVSIPLTGLQARLVIDTLGIYINSATGEVLYATDKELLTKNNLEIVSEEGD